MAGHARRTFLKHQKNIQDRMNTTEIQPFANLPNRNTENMPSLDRTLTKLETQRYHPRRARSTGRQTLPRSLRTGKHSKNSRPQVRTEIHRAHVETTKGVVEPSATWH